MRRIYKYRLLSDDLSIKMPKDAVVLIAKEQDDQICIWAEVETENDLQLKHFDVFGAGHDIPPIEGSRKYIGTAFLYPGLVFHIYERFVT